ncbi:MAG: hypothetical protein JJE55_15420 [Flavobacteriaceae bacterium]|nr:hypothetical protein [Flavobacteriaceae bacterium]
MECFSQVAIGTTTLSNGVSLQLESSNKGLMIPKVALTSRLDITTVTPSLVEGLWVYNTATSGSGDYVVSPGFYFWDSDEWIKMYSEGYTVQYEQTATARSHDNTTIYTIPGLDQTIVSPYTGTYEIHVTGYIASDNHSSTSYEAMVHGSYMLYVDDVKVAESNVTSNTKRTPSSAFQALGRQTTMVYQFDMAEGQSYNFKVRVRQWQQVNVLYGSLTACGSSDGYAFWGICSGPYNGNDGLTDNAQNAYLTITLLRQF